MLARQVHNNKETKIIRYALNQLSNYKEIAEVKDILHQLQLLSDINNDQKNCINKIRIIILELLNKNSSTKNPYNLNFHRALHNFSLVLTKYFPLNAKDDFDNILCPITGNKLNNFRILTSTGFQFSEEIKNLLENYNLMQEDVWHIQSRTKYDSQLATPPSLFMQHFNHGANKGAELFFGLGIVVLIAFALCFPILLGIIAGSESGIGAGFAWGFFGAFLGIGGAGVSATAILGFCTILGGLLGSAFGGLSGCTVTLWEKLFPNEKQIFAEDLLMKISNMDSNTEQPESYIELSTSRTLKKLARSEVSYKFSFTNEAAKKPVNDVDEFKINIREPLLTKPDISAAPSKMKPRSYR